MKQVLLISIPELAPGLNGAKGLMRMHHHAYKAVRDRWTWEIKAAANGHRFIRCSVEIERHYATHAMDADNLYSTAKAPLDALRHANIIPDDDPESVASLVVMQTKVATKKEERTTIRLTAA